MSKKAKIICSSTLLGSFYQILDNVCACKNDFFVDNIILVPDKYTLNAEKLFFEYTKTTSSFNVEIMSLTRLVKKTTANLVKNSDMLSKNTAILLITKILLDNADKLGLIKNTLSPTLAEQFYETIMQFKSSGISPSEVATNSQNINFNLKLKDIQFVYSEYQKNLSLGKIDSADLLDIFSASLKDNQNLHQTNIFVAMFDSFSFKQLEAIISLAKNCKNFEIGLSATTVQPNKNIYLNETLQQVLTNLRQQNIECEIQNIQPKLQVDFNFLSKNLFGYGTLPQIVNKNVTLIESINEHDEVDYIARKIKSLVVFNGIKFSQISVATTNYDNYKQLFKQIFDSYGIPYFVDEQVFLSEHYFGRLILNMLALVCSNFDKNYVLNFLQSPFSQMNSQEFNQFDNYVLEHGINYQTFLQSFRQNDVENLRAKYLSPLITLNQNIKSAKIVDDYINALQVFLEQVDSQNVLANLSKNAMFGVTLTSQTEQVYDKVQNAFSTLSSMLGKSECSVEYFKILLNNLFGAISIKTVPLGVNTVFVGDASSSTFYPSDYLFVVGAVDGSLPSYKNDCGLISDAEIGMLTSKNILNPSIRFTNKVAKYRVFELLMSCQNSLTISFSSLTFGNVSRPSEVFTALKKVLKNADNSTIQAIKLSAEFDALIDYNASPQDYITALGSPAHCKDVISKIGIKNEWLNMASQVVKPTLKKQDNTLKINTKQLFFPYKKTSISQIERYFNCPYQHFVDYGLRLKERKKYGIKNVDVGNFLHRVAELFVDSLIKNKYQYDDKVVTNIIKQVANEQFEFLDKTEKLKADSLIAEAFSLCKKIFEQISSSNFKPIFVEKKFISETYSQLINISGKVDRIDANGNMFLIFDYKTGSKTDFSFKDVYYGNKIQIVLYLDILESLLKLISVGAFYVPIKNKFIMDEKVDKSSGIFLNQTDVIKSIDTALSTQNKRNVFKIDFKADGTLSATSTKLAITPQQLMELKKYVKSLFNNAVSEIMGGNIQPSPTENTCQNCPYSLMCKYRAKQDGFRLKDADISKQSFVEKQQ